MATKLHLAMAIKMCLKYNEEVALIYYKTQ